MSTLASGWLCKQGARFPYSWRTRFFVLAYHHNERTNKPDSFSSTVASPSFTTASASVHIGEAAAHSLKYYKSEQDFLNHRSPKGTIVMSDVIHVQMIFHDEKGAETSNTVVADIRQNKVEGHSPDERRRTSVVTFEEKHAPHLHIVTPSRTYIFRASETHTRKANINRGKDDIAEFALPSVKADVSSLVDSVREWFCLLHPLCRCAEKEYEAAKKIQMSFTETKLLTKVKKLVRTLPGDFVSPGEGIDFRLVKCLHKIAQQEYNRLLSAQEAFASSVQSDSSQKNLLEKAVTATRSIGPVMRIPRYLAMHGKLHLHFSLFRVTCWRIFVGILSSHNTANMDVWKVDIAALRQRYRNITSANRKTASLEQASTTATIDDPLSQAKDSHWATFWKHRELSEEIEKDIERTYMGVPFFDRPVSVSNFSITDSTQVATTTTTPREQIRNVLFAWVMMDKEHERTSYRQGMNELCAVLAYALAKENCILAHILSTPGEITGSAKDTRCNNNGDDKNRLLTMVSPKTALDQEADLFALLHALLDSPQKVPFTIGTHMECTLADLFGKSDCVTATNSRGSGQDAFGSSLHDQAALPAVRLCHHMQHEVLRRVDAELWHHLQEYEISPQLYGLKWVRCLFAREFAPNGGFNGLMILWDFLLAAGATQHLLLAVECICVAMLVRVRRRLIDVGENFILMELMHYEIDEQEGSDTIIIAQGITRAAKMLLTLMGNETSATKDGTGSTTQFLDDVDAELLSQVALGANLESIITTEEVLITAGSTSRSSAADDLLGLLDVTTETNIQRRGKGSVLDSNEDSYDAAASTVQLHTIQNYTSKDAEAERLDREEILQHLASGCILQKYVQNKGGRTAGFWHDRTFSLSPSGVLRWGKLHTSESAASLPKHAQLLSFERNFPHGKSDRSLTFTFVVNQSEGYGSLLDHQSNSHHGVRRIKLRALNDLEYEMWMSGVSHILKKIANAE